MCRVFRLMFFRTIKAGKRFILAMWRNRYTFLSFLGDYLPSFNTSGMRGLMNYGLTCCVNSLLQCLSATWELTDLLNRWESGAVRGSGHNVPLQLKRALVAMQSDQPQPAAHADFLRCLDKNCIRRMVYTQHDADEVFLLILNCIQQQMDNKALAGDIQNLYRISVETQLQCLECSSIQSGTSYLLNLPLHIKEDHNSLEGCITSFFEPQELRGRDSCLCAQCGKTMPSKQGCKLLSLPPILCVHLKRFRSNRGFPRKLDCTITFPETFDFLENLREEALSRDCVKNDSNYVLYAVVVHFGTAASGHYTAYVRHKGNHSWYYANDSHVRQATWEEIQKTYGGRFRETAYMLMYRRSTKEEEEQPLCSG